MSLKEAQNKSEELIRLKLNKTDVEAQKRKLKEHEDKKQRANDELLRIIQHKDNPQEVTNIKYTMKKNKEPTIRITRNNDLVTLTLCNNFSLKDLGLSERLEMQYIALKIFGQSINQLLKNLRNSFQWVVNQAQKFDTPVPFALASLGLKGQGKKRKRPEILQ